MADYKVTDTELISIANAIRTKGGTSSQLEFPAEFISAINAIPTGGSGSILYGSDEPTSLIGNNGDIYLLTGLITNIRMTIYATKRSSGIQLSEVQLYDSGGNVIPWEYGIASTNGTVYSQQQTADKAFDNSINDKWYTTSNATAESPIWIAVALANGIPQSFVSSWGWYTGDDVPDRDPITFDLEFSSDKGETYQIVDHAVEASITGDRKALGYTNTVNVPQSVSDSIGYAYAKVDGVWQPLIGTDINDINL